MAAVDHFSEADIGQEVGPVHPQILQCLVGTGGVTKGRFVKMSDAITFEVVAGDADCLALGVALKTVDALGYVPVLAFGIVKMLSGGTFAAGAHVKSDADGKPVAAITTVTVPAGGTAVTSTSAQPAMTVEGGIAAGRALQKATNTGDEVLIFVGLS